MGTSKATVNRFGWLTGILAVRETVYICSRAV
jgi:hypothetical protein